MFGGEWRNFEKGIRSGEKGAHEVEERRRRRIVGRMKEEGGRIRR